MLDSEVREQERLRHDEFSCRFCYHPSMSTVGRIVALLIIVGIAIFVLFGPVILGYLPILR